MACLEENINAPKTPKAPVVAPKPIPKVAQFRSTIRRKNSRGIYNASYLIKNVDIFSVDFLVFDLLHERNFNKVS